MTILLIKSFHHSIEKLRLKKHVGPREVVAKNDYSFSDKLASSSDIDSLNLPKHHWKDKLINIGRLERSPQWKNIFISETMV